MRKIILTTLITFACIINVVYPMKPIKFPFKPETHSPLEPVYIIFPVLKPFSIGAEAGFNDREKYGCFRIHNGIMRSNFIPNRKAEAGGTKFAASQISENFLLVGSRGVLSFLDLKQEKMIAEYTPELPEEGWLEAIEYRCAKLIDEKKGLVLAKFTPYVDENNKVIDRFSIVIEDVINGKTLKRRLSEGILAFGQSFNVYRKGLEGPWAAYDNNLDQMEHPCLELLNKAEMLIETYKIALSEKNCIAVTLGTDRLSRKNKIMLLNDWKNAKEPLPIIIDTENKMEPDFLFTWEAQYEKSNLSLSPSGKWLHTTFVNKVGPPKYKNVLIYIDPFLPSKYIVFDLGYNELPDDATWMTTPEGFVIVYDNKLYYWDLSVININKIITELKSDN